MLLRLSIRNIKSNIRNYSSYFLSVTFNVLVFYLFSALRYNSTLQNILGGDVKIAATFQISNWLIGLFAVIFLWYSTSYFLVRRKQEIGLYALLGVRRSRIGWSMFSEMMLTNLISLVIGMTAGILLSQTLFQAIGRMLQLTEPLYRGVSLGALLTTSVTFFVIFMFTAFSAFSIVYQYQLSELFSAPKKEETPLTFHKFAAILGILVLCAGYGIIYRVDSGKSFEFGVPIGVAAIAIGTFLVFRETVPAFFTCIRHSSYFYSNLRVMMNTSGTLYRIRKNYRIWAILSLLVSAAVSLIVGAYELTYTLYSMDRQMHPFTFSYISQNKETETEIDTLMQNQTDHRVLQKVITEEVMIPDSRTGTEQTSENKKSIVVISESALRSLEQACGIQTGCPGLSNEDGAMLGYEGGMKDATAEENIAIFNGAIKDISINTFSQYNPAVLSQNRVAIVVNDVTYQQLRHSGTVREIISYLNENEGDTSELTLKLQDILPTNAQLNYAYENTKVLAYTKILFFVLALIGLLFLAATGSILRFKAYSDSEDNIESNGIQRRLGARQKELISSAAAQTRTMFLAPLIMAVLHILLFCVALSHWGLVSSSLPIVLSFCACVCVYMLYYLVTVFALQKKIVKNGGSI